MTNFYCTAILDPAKKLGKIYSETIGVNKIDSFLVNETGITSDFFFQSTTNFIQSSYFMVICDDLGANTAYLPLGINEPIEINSVIEVVNWTNPLQPNALFIDNVTNYLQVMEYALSTQLYFTSDEIYEPRQMIIYEGVNYLIVNKDNNAYVAIKDCTDVIITDIKYNNDFFSTVIWGAIYPLLGQSPVSKDYVDARDLLTLKEAKEYIDSFNLAKLNNRVVSSEIAIESDLDIQYEVFIFNGIVETELTQILLTKDILNAQYMIVNNRPYSINISINSILTEIEPNTIVSFIQTGDLENKTITLAYKTVTDTAIKDIIADIETSQSDIVDIKSDIVDIKTDVADIKTDVLEIKTDITGLQDSKIDKTEKAVAGGVATLDDSTGKIPLSQIDISLIGDMHYVGTWNAETNTPTLENIPTIPLGFFYRVTVTGTQFGIDFLIGDAIVSSGNPNNPTNWDRIPNNNAVNSVNGKIGDVVLTKEDLNIVSATDEVFGEVKFDNDKIILNEQNQLTVREINARTELHSHPTINNVEIKDDHSSEALGLQSKLLIGTHTTLKNNIFDVTTGSEPEQIPTNAILSNIYPSKETSAILGELEAGEIPLRTPDLEDYGNLDGKTFETYMNNGDTFDTLPERHAPNNCYYANMSGEKGFIILPISFLEHPERFGVDIRYENQFYLNMDGVVVGKCKNNVMPIINHVYRWDFKVVPKGTTTNLTNNSVKDNFNDPYYISPAPINSRTNSIFRRGFVKFNKSDDVFFVADNTSSFFVMEVITNNTTGSKIHLIAFQSTAAQTDKDVLNRYQKEAKEEYYRLQNFLTIGGYTEQLIIGE